MLRLFRLTKREYYADFFITPPLTLILLIASLRDGMSLTWATLFVLGVLVWTLYEYTLHRWVLHWVRGFKSFHELHHEDQKEYIAVHPLLTLAVYSAFWMLLGLKSGAFSVGFSVGYIMYSITHTLCHYSKGTWRLRRRHALHHKFDHLNFGVTTSLWDKLFGTEFK